jgi:hypothetical protein
MYPGDHVLAAGGECVIPYERIMQRQITPVLVSLVLDFYFPSVLTHASMVRLAVK